MDISILIPLFNEAEIINDLYTKLVETLDTLDGKHEIIFIDDGSTDDSFSILEEIHHRDSSVRIIRFRKNFGKSAALHCGFQHAEGDIVVTMDCDLQDEPREIPTLIAEIHTGHDLVSAWRVKRADSLFKRVLSRIFNGVTALLTGIKLHDFNSGLKAYRREIAQELNLYGELHRFIPVLACWKGARISEVQVEHHPRKYGKSRYGAARIWRGAWDFLTILFLTKYASSPLYLFGLIGLLLGVSGFVINSYLAVIWFMGQHIGHRPLLTLGVLLLIMGGQFISMGLLSEMIVSQRRNEDQYSIRMILGNNTVLGDGRETLREKQRER